MSATQGTVGLDSAASVQAQVLAALQRGQTPKLAAAYVKAWGELGNVQKDRTNPHLQNDYATLEACLNSVKPVFARHGLALLQIPAEARDGMCAVVGMLMHESGEQINFRTEVHVSPQINKKTGAESFTAQGDGGGFTYARRYQIMAVAGQAPTDDDGNEASGYSEGAAPKKGVADAAPTLTLDERIKHFVAANDLDGLVALKDEVKNSGEQKIADAWGAARTTIKTALNKKKEEAK